jgi:hypothetical protein
MRYFILLEKEQVKPQISRQKEIMKMTAAINEMEIKYNTKNQ